MILYKDNNKFYVALKETETETTSSGRLYTHILRDIIGTKDANTDSIKLGSLTFLKSRFMGIEFSKDSTLKVSAEEIGIRV